MIPSVEEIGGQSMSDGRSGIGRLGARETGGSVGGGPSGCLDVQLLRTSSNMWEERRVVRRGDWWESSEQTRGGRMLPRVGSLHYLCGHCGHAGHSLLVRGGIKPRSSHNILEPTADLRSREKPSRPKSLHSSFEPINVPDGRRKKKRRR